MGDVLMYKMIEIQEKECALIYGGRDEDVARFVEFVSQCVGALAKLVYLAAKRGQECLSRQIASGSQIVWK